jgi:hypothetical protein
MKLRSLVAALMLMVAGATTHAACAQMVSRPALGVPVDSMRTIAYGWMSHTLAFTYCQDGVGHTFINANQSGLDRIDTEAHEAVHREQFARYPSCVAFERATHSLTAQVLIEAEAYAAGVCAQVTHGLAAPRLSLERNYAERISYWITARQVTPFNILPIIQAFESCR